MAHNRTNPKPNTIIAQGYNNGKDLMITYLDGEGDKTTRIVPMHDPDLFIKGMRHFLNIVETKRGRSEK
jgi:hypothetical protein